MKDANLAGISRRRLLELAGLTAGAALVARLPLLADEGASAAHRALSTSNASFGSLKQIDSGLLNVSYAEAGPVDGRTVILLHGWPYDIYSFVDVV